MGNLGHAGHDGSSDESGEKLIPKAHLFLPAAAKKTKRMMRLQQMNWVTLQPMMIRNEVISTTRGIIAYPVGQKRSVPQKGQYPYQAKEELILIPKTPTFRLFIGIGIKNHDVAVIKDLAKGGGVGLPAKDDEVAILIRPTQVGVATAGDVN